MNQNIEGGKALRERSFNMGGGGWEFRVGHAKKKFNPPFEHVKKISTPPLRPAKKKSTPPSTI